MTLLRLGLISLTALSFAGCVEVDQEISINRDGSGQLKGHFAIPQSTMNMLEATKKQGGGGMDSKSDVPMTEEDVRKKFADKKDVKVTDVKVEDKDGKHHVSFTAEFKTLQALLDGAEIEGLSLTKDAEGNYTLSSPPREKEKKAKSPEEEQTEKQMKAAMLPMLKGLKITMRINTPTEIISTTAAEKTPTSATWVFDIDKDPSFMDTEPELNVKFKGAGVDLPEIKAQPKTAEMPAPPAQR